MVAAEPPKLEDFLGCGPSIETEAAIHQISYFEPLHEMYPSSLKTWAHGLGGFGELSSLSLSMSPETQSNSSSSVNGECFTLESAAAAKKRGGGLKQPAHRKSIDSFGQRTSQYRGVTRSVKKVLIKF